MNEEADKFFIDLMKESDRVQTNVLCLFFGIMKSRITKDDMEILERNLINIKETCGGVE